MNNDPKTGKPWTLSSMFEALSSGALTEIELTTECVSVPPGPESPQSNTVKPTPSIGMPHKPKHRRKHLRRRSRGHKGGPWTFVVKSQPPD